VIKFHGISMPEGAALSWPLSDIVIRRKNGFAFRCRVRGCSLLDQRPVLALPRRRRERYRQTTSPEGVKIGRRASTLITRSAGMRRHCCTACCEMPSLAGEAVGAARGLDGQF